MTEVLTPCDVRKSRLPSGIRVLTESIPHCHSVALTIVGDVGPQDESEQHAGIAHLCEHAFFLGTGTRGEQDIAELIDTAGGQLGAFTARDYTCLNATVTSDYLTYALDLLGDMLSNVQFSDERLHHEKEVIKHELDEHQDSPESSLDERLKQLLWPGDPLGRSIIGTPEGLGRIEPADVRRFIRTQYTPDRLIVAAAGRLDHDSIVEQVHDALWQLRGDDTRQSLPLATSQHGLIVESSARRSALVSIMIPMPAYADPDRYALHVLSNLLGGGMSSRLYREIRERMGIAYCVSSQLHAYRRGGALVIEVSTPPETVMMAITAVYTQLTRLAWEDQPIGEEELWKAKMQTRGQAYLSSDSIQTRVSRLAMQEHYFGNPLEQNHLLQSIDEVDLNSVCNVARRVLGEGISSAVIGVSGVPEQLAGELRSEISDMQGCFQ
ncbi:MAG: pitrilysin family protein [Planctomycetota bacterium]